MPYVSSLRGASVSNLGEGPLFLAREKVLSAEPDTRSSRVESDETLCAELERRPSVSSLGGGPHLQARKETLSAKPKRRPRVEPERRPSAPSMREGPLCRAWEKAHCV